MRTKSAALAACILLAACDGNPFAAGDAAAPTTPTDPATPPTDETPVTDAGIPTALANDLESVTYDPVAKTLFVTMKGLDGTPKATQYTRDSLAEAGMPPGFEVYRKQEDPLDRLFLGVVKNSFDGTTRAAVVADGGQFNRYFSGAYYERDGDFTPPTIGDGPGEGQVSYAGDYAGLNNYSGPRPTLPPGSDPSLQMAGPGRVTGKVFLNANFSDMQVNGVIYNRTLLNPGTFNPLDDVVLVVTDIDAAGTFLGSAEIEVEESIGSYGGTFGGIDAASVAGVIAIEGFDDDLDFEAETGVFVLTQCGKSGEDVALCAGTAP